MSRLETEPATRNQLGAVMAQFRRCGIDGSPCRELRHQIAAGLLGLEELDDWRDLRMGQAGKLLHSLQDYASADEAIAAAGIVTPRQAARARARTRFLARLLAAYIAAEMAARIRQEATRHASTAPVQEPAA